MKDLHIHTIYSDGEDNEYEIIEKVKEAGIKEFAICDHNTIVGSKKVHDLLLTKNEDLIFHSGVELTCRLSDYKKPFNAHILLRDFDYDSEEVLYLINKYQNFEKIKLERMKKIVKSLYNIEILDREIAEIYAHSQTVGKPHIYSIITKYISLDREKYYRDMDALITDDLKLDILEVISISNKIGANVILAHPIEIMEDHNFTFEDIDNLCGYLKEKGLNAIETRHSKHNEEYYNKFHEIAIKHNLSESQGSDYHGSSVKPDVKLGKYYK